jgi:predicted MPP superfamily phosphohydrolase
MIFFFRSLLVQIFLNAYFLFRIKKSKELGRFPKRFLYVVFILETLLYFIGLAGKEYMPSEYFVWIYKIDVYWSVFFIYLVVLLSVSDVILFLNKKWAFYIQFSPRSLRWVSALLILLFFVCIGRQFQASRDDYLPPEIKEFPFSFAVVSNDTVEIRTTYRLLVVADLHLGHLINKDVLKKYVEIINAQHADIIVIDGDLIDYSIEQLEEQGMDNELKKLHAFYGVYLIPGNHEYKGDPEANFQWISQAGITVLRDSVANIGDHLQLIGRDDRRNKAYRMNWEQLVARSDTDKVRILFAHQPQDINQAVLDENIPLIVSGHTHNGELFPMNWINRFIFPNSYGMQKDGNSFFYTTSGLGLSGFPFRIGTESEMVIFNIGIN